MRIFTFLIFIIFTNISYGQSQSRTEILLKEFQEKIKNYNQERTIENYLKYFVRENDREAQEFFKSKVSLGQLVGSPPEINVKENVIYVGGDYFKVIDLEREKYSINEYEFEFKKNMTLEDRFSYVERILRTKKNSFLIRLFPFAHAGMGNWIAAPLNWFGGGARTKEFGEGLEELKPYQGLRHFECQNNSVSFSLAQSGVSSNFTIIPPNISEEQKNQILSTQMAQINERPVTDNKLFKALWGEGDRKKRQAEKNKADLASAKSKYEVTNSVVSGNVSYLQTGVVDSIDNRYSPSDDGLYCFNTPKGHYTEENENCLETIGTFSSYPERDQLEVFKKLYLKEFVELERQCSKEDVSYLSGVSSWDYGSNKIKCELIRERVAKKIKPYWADLVKVVAAVEKQNQGSGIKKIVVAANNCSNEDKNRDGCCQSISEKFRGKALGPNSKQNKTK
jgi:hypothetical protein